MSNSSRKITLHYERTLQKADDLESLANQLQSIAQRNISSAQAMVSHNWKGESGEAYRKKLEREQLLVSGRAKRLKEAAQTLRDAAKAVYYREMYALSVLEKMSRH